ncbi:hypothetical protein [Catenisphaera adipataccumulans]|jgi:hypothetical protein|uniref:Uncharacterized protein n=1 Tax=Catenisphaera adipataccumulans TaxID=700500 RepID=A0A7W8CXM4_9FIRM|nr:hypothetical protein [Catenisphaera adipataccumulans]MBB5183493.1 hypothetical protein [Catenisphaera adipataccumulans]
MKYSVSEILPYLDEGETAVETENRMIVRKVKDKISLYQDHWHTKIPAEDFLTLYAQSSFILYDAEDTGISEEKDEEYYAWRRRSQ